MGSVSDCSTGTVKSIIESASRAPSGDNVQPWSYIWNGKLLTIAFHGELARHILDAGLSASTIALGCLLESLRIAASAHGQSAPFTFLGLPGQDGACAEIRFIADSPPVDRLFAALPQRTTDRRAYRRGPVPEKELTEIWREFDENNVARVDFASPISSELLDFIVAAEALVATHSSIFPDTLPWIRLTQKEVARSRDGMPWRGTGIGPLEYPAVCLMRWLPQSFHVFRRAGMVAAELSRFQEGRHAGHAGLQDQKTPAVVRWPALSLDVAGRVPRPCLRRQALDAFVAAAESVGLWGSASHYLFRADV
jgi:hypothetical protein